MKKVNENMIKIKDNKISKKEYIDLYNMYRFFFTKYMMEKLNLKKYDLEIKNSDYNFIPVEEANMDLYQFFSSDELEYIYIRNNIYIEKLSEDEIDILKERIKKEDYTIDERMNEFIEKTYEKVIFEDLLKNGKKYNITFGPDSRNFFARNDSLVIGIRYDEFADTDISDEEWGKQNEKQEKLLRKIYNEMKEDIKNKINIPIEIIQYDDCSVDVI